MLSSAIIKKVYLAVTSIFLIVYLICGYMVPEFALEANLYEVKYQQALNTLEDTLEEARNTPIEISKDDLIHLIGVSIEAEHRSFNAYKSLRGLYESYSNILFSILVLHFSALGLFLRDLKKSSQ
ncbi:hypothetical protein G3R49_02305 [Shewanella sp. WXL01]|uniref:hypothetical protein n=1 Tax=Shewanella sp. WXL01 TaxID=2709721 RepID=UPI001438395C|nr:hypothetical protein [Shewanella sp. WXL01]NKF49414.1 hypothetical protein [Shewanella sp. WXL01]